MHECPDCYAVCYCGGDIDDMMFDDNQKCTHWRECEADRDESYFYDESSGAEFEDEDFS